MTNDMNDPLHALKAITPPPPSDAARQRALAAGRMAFEAGKADAAKNTATAPQGQRRASRLSSIITSWKGKSIMDMRLPIGTAAVALLLLPLGYQLYSSTALSPADRVAGAAGTAPAAVPPAETKAVAATPDVAESTLAEQEEQAAPAAEIAAAPPPAMPEPAQADMARRMPTVAPASPMTVSPMTATESMVVMPSPQMAPPSGDVFTPFDESPLKLVAETPVSTFSIDVDTASYAYVRSMLDDGFVPEPDAVRLEELINYFPYDYAPADSATQPFKPSMAVFPTPWNPKTQLLEIGIKGYVPPAEADTPSNLVFLIDTSGSMDAPDKLPLLKRAFGLLVDQLSGRDTVSIVAYAGSAGVVLEPTKADDKAKILAALDHLSAGGSTAGAAGIELAYRLAEQARVSDGTNRVILATDGDFNVGIADPQALEDFIKAKREGGVTLSVLGFGRGNLDDATMQALAQNGNGNASYIDNFREAQKVLVEEGGATLHTIAKDVKIQVEFNPAAVSEYRLIGYETRALKREDFNNDAVDAGDIGAGHTVTALYEITPVGSGGALVDPLRYGADADAAPAAASAEIAFLKMRYKLPQETVSQLLEVPVMPSVVYADIDAVSPDMKFAAAVAAFGQKLKGSAYGAMDWADILALAQAGRGADASGYRAEFLGLVKTAALLKPDGSN